MEALPSTPQHATVHTNLLIVGAGPAGASLACFLARYGHTGLLISSAPGPSLEPRGHITNAGTLECLRDIGLEDACLQLGHAGDAISHVRWCYSLCGEEYGRVAAFGSDETRRDEFVAASPCGIVDLPQSLLEPVLVKYARDKGWTVRFNTRLESCCEDEKTGIVHAVCKDLVTETRLTIQAKWLFGADGARSQVAREVGIPFVKKADGGVAWNVLVRTGDLTETMRYRGGNLHLIVRNLEIDVPDHAFMTITRMVKPWTEWLCVVVAKPGTTPTEPTREQLMGVVKDAIGDDSVPIEILDVSTWTVREAVAERYSQGNVFCLGDAVHRHPPALGLGSNTGIQDAYNLAWKVDLVLKGKADRWKLLNTYSAERQPIGANVVQSSNKAWRNPMKVLKVFGHLNPDTPLEARKAGYALVKEDSPAGRKKRQELRTALDLQYKDFNSLGAYMGQRYEGSAIYNEETEVFQPDELVQQDPLVHYQRSTYPGCRLPHVWVDRAIPEKPISTIDLAGRGAFCLFTGQSGRQWVTAAGKVATLMNVDINTATIGFRQEWEDPYGEWERIRGVEEGGCVLARPDRFVAWRTKSMLVDEAACKAKLLKVMRSILGMERDEVGA